MDTSTWIIPETVHDLASAVKSHLHFNVGGINAYRFIPEGRWSRSYFDENNKLQPLQGPKPVLLQEPRHKLLLDGLNKIILFCPDDQIITVEAGILLSDLNNFLSKFGFEVPVGLRAKDQEECVGDLIGLNLPHWNMAKGGSWRDWIVKMKIVLASGEVVVSGADVVKSVSGFDLHKLMVGARHTLGVIAEVTLRVKPKSQPREFPPIQLNHGVLFHTNPSGLKAALAFLEPLINGQDGKYVMEYYCDEENSLLLAETLYNQDQIEFDHAKCGHLYRSHVSEFALPEFSDAEKKLMRRTKEIFDPTYKLNPGEFGFI